MCLLWYNLIVTKITEINYTPKQGRFPVFISDLLEISDPVIVFDHVMEAIGVQKYLKGAVKSTGRVRYNPVICLKQSCLLLGTKDTHPYEQSMTSVMSTSGICT